MSIINKIKQYLTKMQVTKDNPTSLNVLDDYKPEENRGKNLEIPLFELEQRVERIEQGYTSMQAELINKLADSVS